MDPVASLADCQRLRIGCGPCIQEVHGFVV